jgi:hypothetical protein
MQLTERKTMNPVHLLLTVLTGGLWAPVWALKHGANRAHNQRVAIQQEGYAMALNDLERFAVSAGTSSINVRQYIECTRHGVNPYTAQGIVNNIGSYNTHG